MKATRRGGAVGVVIRNGTVVTALESRILDIRCEGGRIVEISPRVETASGDEVIDASGAYVFPGGVDPHVHMELPLAGTVSADDFESGTAAGVAGGTTTIVDFVTPDRRTDPVDALVARRAEAGKAVCDYALHMAITSWSEGTPAAMRRCVEHEGITSFKVYMAYRDTVGIDDAAILEVMRTAAELGAVVLVHAEHGAAVEHLRARFAGTGQTGPRYHALSRPPQLEGEATHRALTLAQVTGATLYVVHMTCRESVRALADARERGQLAHGETCPQYLVLDDSVYEKPGFEGAAFVMSPPIRPRGHQEALWAALRAGTVQSVGTDHCPFNLVGQKDLGLDDFRLIPNGAAGIQDRLSLLYTFGVLANRIDIHQFVDITSTRPAKIFGLHPRKGSIAVGADADLVVWDPAGTRTISATTHRHRVDRSIYEGISVKGVPAAVVLNGRVAVRGGDLDVERGAGRYVGRGRE
jgi:dihydropyrimidinase